MSGKPIRPQNQITFGGVNTNQNEIASKKVVNENGTTRYVINFKNGTTVKYPAQAAKNNSVISEGRKFQRIYGAEIIVNKDTKIKDFTMVNLDGCRNCTVYTSQNSVPDTVYIGNDYWNSGKKSTGNKVIQGEDDTTIMRRYELDMDNIEIEGAGTHIEGQENNPL